MSRLLLLAGLLATGLAAASCDSSEPAATANTPIAAPAPKSAVPTGADFDFYVLSLSWSPSYCAAEGEGANRQQCESGRPYAFVVHGLWPQFERGYPQDCATEEPDVDQAALRGLYDIMPSAGLIRYQWRKHGSCSGLSQRDYFDVLRKAREAVSVPGEFARLATFRSVAPDDVETRFLQSNPSMIADGTAVTCDARYLREVRICLTKQLAFRSCPEVDRRACKLEKAVMPPIRGG